MIAWAFSAKAESLNKNRSGLALQGYDPVAYFRASMPLKGSPQFTYSWMGAVWYFSNATNRDLFIADPVKYAPQFGGYCAWAVSNGYTANIDPEAWKIVDGKLYVNYSKDVQRNWEKDLETRIQQGNRHWEKLKGRP